MRQKQTSELSENNAHQMDALDCFGLEVERESLIATLQAMIRAIGSEKTINLLRPYLELSGKAFALNLAEWTKDDDSILTLAKTIVMGQAPIGQECKTFYVKGGEAFFESEGCPFLGTLPEICECYCDILGGAFTKQIDHNLETDVTPGNGKDDRRCKWRFYSTTQTPFLGFSNREVDVNQISNQISKEELRWRSHHYIGGVWLMFTYAMVTNLDSKPILDSLSGDMKRNGFSFGIRSKQYLGINGQDMDSALIALKAFGKATMQEPVILYKGPEELRVQVKECQWCGHDYSTPEFCQFIETINDNVCKSINPMFQFRYCSMKTNGADECIWTVRKENPAKRDTEVSCQSSSDDKDLISLLKIRLVKGEITLEQYEKITQVLKGN
jgi:hypothetical protein